jgi:hypothetical protein
VLGTKQYPQLLGSPRTAKPRPYAGTAGSVLPKLFGPRADPPESEERMMSLTLRHWFGIVIVGCVVTAGCNQTQRRSNAYTMPRPMYSVTVLPAQTEKPAYAAAAEQQSAPKQEADTLPPPPKEVLPAACKEDDSVRRRSFADITAKPGFGHAPDYCWLVGELQYVHVRKAWRLRYASVDEEDRYGGSVTLVEMGSMDNYSNGQMVRVEGQLLDSESREPSPMYRVRSMQTVGNQ